MPELPDLVYIRDRLAGAIVGRTVIDAVLKKVVVLRTIVDAPFEETVRGAAVSAITVRGPFLTIECGDRCDLVVNLMLAGRMQLQQRAEKPAGYLCLSLGFDDGRRLNICDEQTMAKVYLVRHGDDRSVPKLRTLGVDLLSPAFTRPLFHSLAAANSRKQVRVFINDHTVLSAIGNAYADEILFEARIHPKTIVSRLSSAQIDALYDAIGGVLAWGIARVREANAPIQEKIRTHMKVRNRHGKPCPRCGTTIRREGVRGYDVFFCPRCQPSTRKALVDWRKTGR
jgi:formamidopyrimidine-DNA glycosylase